MNKVFFYAYDVFAKDNKKNTYTYLLTSLITSVMTIAVLFATKRVADIVQANAIHGSYRQILMMVIELIVILCISSISSSIQAISLTNLIEFSEFEQERTILNKNNQLCLEDLDSPEIKTLRGKARRFSFIDAFVQEVTYFTNLVVIVAMISILLYYHCFLLVGVIILLLLVRSQITKVLVQSKEKIYQKQATMNRVCNYLFQLLIERDNIMEIRVYGMFKYLRDRMLKTMVNSQKEIHNQVCIAEAINMLQNIVMSTLNGGAVVLIVLANSNRIGTVGTFVILFQITSQLFSGIQTLLGCYEQVKASQIQFKDFSEFMELPVTKRPSVYYETNNKGIEIHVDNVSFRYGDNQVDTLKNINLQIYPGEKIAIVGENGAGKSTLVKLIMGLYEPKTGRIHWKLGGRDIAIKETINGFKVVFQDYLKLLRTVRENIAMGDITQIDKDQKLLGALEKAGAKDIAAGLDTKLGPEFGGKDLSGGQWQKLAMARAYFSERLVTIFDEPTAALDSHAESEAFQSFVKLSGDNTAIIVTHRLYMTQFVDRIMVVDNGEIVEIGSHEELMQKNGKYNQMFSAQASFYL